MSKLDYGELLCEAVDTIVTERLNGVSYDQTILCTVVDNSQKEKGIYVVSNGSVKFEAYSTDINYKENDNVYVQIPNSDWNEQKFIIAKKTKENENESFIYNNPFATLVDITGNIINSEIPSNESGLIANNPDKNSITLWTYNIEEEAVRKQVGNPLADYTRLGIQASFQSWLNPFYIDNIAHEVVKGEYGLRLHIKATKSRKVEELETEYDYDLILNTEDMNGNPYNFESFYVQEKVFDISNLGKINSIALEFYQKPGTFTDSKGAAIPYLDFLGNSIAPNLFVKDIYICAGYDTSEFDDEMVKVYTLDSLTYSRSTEPYENNHKQIQLRWIHKQEDGTFKSITEKDNLNFTIRWYRYELGRPSADEYSDVYWKYLSFQDTVDKESTYSIQDTDWLEYNTECPDGDERQPDFFSTWLIPDIALQTEQIKAIIIYNGKPYRSNILTCTNENEVVSRPTVDAIQALSINCEDGSYGNYRIYAEGNSLINPKDSSEERNFKAYFKLSGEEAHELIEARSITWMIPVDNSMIELDDAYKASNTDAGYYYEIKDGYHYITRYADNNGQIFNTQPYYIKGYYSADYGNNIIRCTIEKEKNTFYSATKELTFGIAGTTGTDTTLILDFKNTSISAIMANINETTEIVANLYDVNNANVTEQALALGCQWIWEWEELQPSNRLSIGENQGNLSNICKIRNQLTTSIAENEWNILKCTLKGWGDYDLIAYLAIPLMMPYEDILPLYIEGATNIIYTSEGNPQYYKGPYKFYYQLNNNSANTPNFDDYHWEVYYNTELYNIEEDHRFLPYLNKDNALKALNVYVKNCTNNITVNYYKQVGSGKVIVWSQPILILQNRYPSAMLNKWDGSLTIDEENNAILASRLAAGRKVKNEEDQNTFSGVAIGDWNFEGDQQTGLYGFHTGAMSYAFKEDGSAFIGKDGAGRIYFDGNSGTIYSASWNANTNIGMFMDLDQGILKMRQDSNEIIEDDYTLVALNESTWQPNTYWYLEPYILSTGSYVSGRIYYEPTSFKLVNINSSQYKSNKYYIIEANTTEDDKGNITVNSTNYVLSTGGFDSEQKYYCPTYYNQIYVSSGSYSSYKYYYDNEAEIQKDNGSYFDPTYQYYKLNNPIDNPESTNNRFIDIDATAQQYPLTIGAYESPSSRKFRVTWDGTVYIENGNFNGYINATSGSLGNLNVTGILTGGTISGALIDGATINGAYIAADYLSANNGQIGGWAIGENYLSDSKGSIYLNSEDGTIYGGTINGTYVIGSKIEGNEVIGGTVQGTIITGSSVETTYLFADNGEIGGWLIGENYLSSPTGGITLDSSTDTIYGGTINGTYVTGSEIEGGTITGATISAGILTSASEQITLEGYFTLANGGYIGQMDSNNMNTEGTGIGMMVLGGGKVIAATDEAAMECGNSSISIQPGGPDPVVQVYGEGIPTKIESTEMVYINGTNGIQFQGGEVDFANVTSIKFSNHSNISFESSIVSFNSATIDFTNAKTTGLYATLA